MDKQDFMQHDEIKPDAANSPLSEQGKGPAKAPEVEPPITSRDWWIRNGPSLAFVAAFLYFLFGVLGVTPVDVAKVAVGLGLVIFLHELGHFLAAKWCNVHVTTFSIGFGPAIPGCSFQWGETTYKFSMFPLGGYVQMVGQVDGEEGSDGSEDDPRSYRNKSVSQRMLIISAGVIMNVLLAILCFIVVFRGPGKDRLAGVIGYVDTSAPAFKYGLRSGAEIVQIGDVKNPYFENLMVRVMANMRGEKVEFISKRPGDAQVQDLLIEPRNDSDKGDQKFVIGLLPAQSAELLPKRYSSKDEKSPVQPDSAAARATPPFEFGDKIVATTDPADPAQITDLPDDPRFPGHGRRDFFELWKRLQLLAGKDVILRVARGEGKDAKTVDITLPPTFYQTLGARMQMGHITNVRDDSPAAKAGVVVTRKIEDGRQLRGDLIQTVEVTEPDGTITKYDDKNLDPERLPFQLREWAKRMEDKKIPTPWKVALTVSRYKDFGEGNSNPFESKTLELNWDNSWRFDRMLPMSQSSPLAIAELGLAYQIKSIVAGIIPGQVVDNPLQPGDAIREIQLFKKDSKSPEAKVTLKDESEQWAFIATTILQAHPEIKKVVLKVYRDKNTEEVTMVPSQDKTCPSTETGLEFMTDMRRQKASTTVEAIGLGFSDTFYNMKQVFHNLRGMIIGTISPTQLAGPITMARLAYKIAGMDFWEFIFFLGLISVNLAVLNFLPIPVLDGGHFVFLIYEKVRGKPASEGIRIGATYAGLALILCLMVFVLYLDISRLF